MEQFYKWISEIDQKEGFNKEIQAFHFGIIEGENGYFLYLTGSKEYSLDNDDWACNDDFEPEEKYFALPGDLTKDKNWQDILKISSDFLYNYTQSKEFSNSIFKNAVAITTGFDDGGLHRIV
ncbi:hypothetical protein [Tenacibaculum sp. 190524A05c]|uniref:hypothetical protein n=1 Tax=Tenacibaculum platacis TaxID=3137852 RepID=UPI0032B2E3A1